MKLDRFIRLSLGLFVLLIFVIAIAAMLFVTESAFNVWDRLLAGPRWVLYLYATAMLSLVCVAVWLTIRLLVRRERKPGKSKVSRLSPEEIKSRLHDAEKAGVNTDEAQAELRELASRQQSGSVHLCFFGEVSAGKSSLIKALVPDADVVIDVVAGSTSDIRHYRWRDQGSTQILLTDVPGTGGHESQFDEMAELEARRAHVVLFVCDSDLTRADMELLKWLIAMDKPLILVLNKSDRYSRDEQALLMQRLLDRLGDIGSDVSRDRVVAVSAGGEVEVITRNDDGSEAAAHRTRPADVGVLVVAINRLLDLAGATLDARRDRAVFYLASEYLAQAESQYREQRAQQLIRNTTRKAVIGALAAVSPGTDVLIQGYIGTRMTQDLCQLYGTTPRDVDVEEFLNLSQSRAGTILPLSLAVAGNGLKAFPGLGTVAGGLVHAVAYGLIFDALGRSLIQTLAKHGELQPATAAREFEEGISEHIEAGVRQVAKMALEQEKKSGDH